MKKSQNQGKMVSAAVPQIAPVYSRAMPTASYAIASTASYYQTMIAFVAAVLSSCGASEFFTQDIEEMGGQGK